LRFGRVHAWTACWWLSVTLLLPAAGLAGQEEPDTSDAFTIQGEVLDAVTGIPLSGVLVTLHDIWKITRTDKLGYFEFPDVPGGKHELGVYGLGFITIEEYLEFAPDEILEIKLSPAPLEIEGLEVAILSNSVKEYRSFGTRYDFIGGEEMEMARQKYGRITDMLRRFPGIRVWDPGGPANGICIRSTRGSTSPNVSAFGCAYMLIDGLEATPEDVAQLDTDVIKSIRYVSRLEALFVYGERGQFGVLLIETLDGRD
jgi:CarboxypepD_reg-like domain